MIEKMTRTKIALTMIVIVAVIEVATITIAKTTKIVETIRTTMINGIGAN